MPQLPFPTPTNIRLLVSERCPDYAERSRLIEEQFATALAAELPKVQTRYMRLCEVTGMSMEELPKVASSVPQYVVEFPDGGLGVEGPASGKTWAMVPCRQYLSHAVYYNANLIKPGVVLVSARLPHKPWHPKDDILHEYVHARFAPIPMYVQAWHIQMDESAHSLDLDRVEDLAEHHVGWIIYAVQEIGTGFLTGERRPSETGLPVLESNKALANFLRLSSRILPEFGFDHAWTEYQKYGLNENAYRALVVSCLRAQKIFPGNLSKPHPPLEDFRKRMSRI